MVGLFLAFIVASASDPFTDEVTHRAYVGNEERGPGLVIECAPAEWPVWSVHVSAGRYIEAEFLDHANMLVRFNDAEPQTIMAEYGTSWATVEGGDAEELIDQVATEGEVVFGLRSHDPARIDVTIDLEGGQEAIEEIRALCSA